MNNEEKKQLAEEQRWLKGIQSKLKKYINSPYWDDITISNLQLDLVTIIMNTSDVRNLSPTINERLTDSLLDSLQEKINRAKKNSRVR